LISLKVYIALDPFDLDHMVTSYLNVDNRMDNSSMA